MIVLVFVVRLTLLLVEVLLLQLLVETLILLVASKLEQANAKSFALVM
jgi:hypothetical protein